MASPDSPTTSSTLLGLLAQAENDAAWRRFVGHYTPLIDHWCRVSGLQPADTDEIRSRVFEGLVTALKGFCYDPAGRFRGYLRAAVNNAIWTYLRQRATRPGMVGVGGDGSASLDEIVSLATPDLATLLDDSMTADLRDAYRVVERVQGMVEPETWRAWWLVGIEGKPASEVAAMLGKSVAAVYMAKSRVGKLLQVEGQRFLEVVLDVERKLQGVKSQSPRPTPELKIAERVPPTPVRISDRPGDRTHRISEHYDYLNRMAAEGVVSHSLAETARTVWEQAVIVTDDWIPVPPATAVEGGPVRYTWDQGDHHLETEIPDGGLVEWFYQNRTTGEVWSVDLSVTDPFPPALCTRLFRVALAIVTP